MSTVQLPQKPDSNGFTLIEVLVAFVILTTTMTVIYAIFSNGLNSLNLSSDYTRAALLAESQLAGVGVLTPLQAGEQQGRFDDRYGWDLQISAVAAAPAGRSRAEPLLDARQQPELYRLALTLSWHRAGREREFRLETLRLMSPGAVNGGLRSR